MMKKVVLAVLVFVLAFGATAVYAGDDSGKDIIEVEVDGVGLVPMYADGRLNAFDISAPVTLYYSYTKTTILDENGYSKQVDTIGSIQVWGISSLGTGFKVLDVPMSDIKAKTSAGGQASYQGGGATLTCDANNWCWVTYGSYTYSWKLP